MAELESEVQFAKVNAFSRYLQMQWPGSLHLWVGVTGRRLLHPLRAWLQRKNIVGTMGVLYGGEGSTWAALAGAFTTVAGLSFLIFNLLCAPCFAAIGAIRREMNNAKWTWFAIGCECGFAYVVSFVVFQLGSAFAGNANILGCILAVALIVAFIWLLFRPYKEATTLKKKVQ